jgi:hypothetical protein
MSRQINYQTTYQTSNRKKLAFSIFSVIKKYLIGKRSGNKPSIEEITSIVERTETIDDYLYHDVIDFLLDNYSDVIEGVSETEVQKYKENIYKLIESFNKV